MKRRFLAVLLMSVVMTVVVAGCGKEEPKTVSTPDTKVEVATEKQVENTPAPEPEVQPEVNTEVEEVIGDVDTGELSAENCSLWKLGLDVKNRALDGVEATFDYSFLFPNAAYVTSEGAGYLKAEGIVVEYIDISLSPVADAKPLRDVLLDNGNATVTRTIKYDSVSSYKATYAVKNGDNNMNINLEIKIKVGSTEEEQTIFRNFVDSYVPAFEESLTANFN